MVYVFLAEGFEETEAVVTIDILRRAGIDVRTVSVSSDKNVKGAHNICINADILIDEVDASLLEAVALPGGMPGTKNLTNSEKLKNIVLKAVEDGKIAAAICAAPSAFGAWGLINGINVTCYKGFENKLGGGIYLDEKVVEDGLFITANGAGSAHLFAFAIVKRLKGEEKANEIKKAMLYE